MTKQEFIDGKPFTINGTDYRFEQWAESGVLMAAVPGRHEMDHFCNVVDMDEDSVTVSGTWLGFKLQRMLQFKHLRHFTDKNF